MKFRKKPVVIEAFQWTGDNYAEIKAFVGDSLHHTKSDNLGNSLKIATLEGDHIASVGDWIIRGVKGEFYPCKPDIFAATYEPADAGDDPTIVGVRCDCPMCEHHVGARGQAMTDFQRDVYTARPDIFIVENIVDAAVARLHRGLSRAHVAKLPFLKFIEMGKRLQAKINISPWGEWIRLDTPVGAIDVIGDPHTEQGTFELVVSIR